MRLYTRGEALRALARPVLLAAWALVFWGTLLLAVAAFDVLGEGLVPVLARLLPAHGASLWAWLNAVSCLLALVAWAVVAALVVRRARDGEDDEPSSS